MVKKVAAYVRVSTSAQDTENQLPAIKALCEQRGWQLVKVYSEHASAYVQGKQTEWKKCVRDAVHHHHEVIAVWALDRVSREGALKILSAVHHLKEKGISLVSVQETWADSTNDFNDILFSIAGWVAREESKRKSERTRAGIKERQLSGGGRRGKDKKPRKRRWLKRPTATDNDLLGVT